MTWACGRRQSVDCGSSDRLPRVRLAEVGAGLFSPNYPCPECSDADWLRLGIARVFERVESGRTFLQEHGPRFAYQPTRAKYFVAQNSARRLELVRDVNRRLLAKAQLPDQLARFPELKNYRCFALDGHWHQAATHDARHDGAKLAVGHFYSLDLRGHQLRHLAVG